MCFLINLHPLFSQAQIIFGNGIKHKKHEKYIFSRSFFSVPLFTLQFPKGPFSFPERVPLQLWLPKLTKRGISEVL